MRAIRLAALAFVMASDLSAPMLVNATSVIALIDKSNHKLVIAADSLVVNPASGSHPECKIIVKPGCAVAIAGLYHENATGFDLRTLVDAACRYPGDLREKSEAFVRLAKRPFELAVQHIRVTDPDDFKQTTENKPTEVIFAGRRGEHLALLVRGLIGDSHGKVRVERFESTETSTSSIGYVVGLNRKVREKAHFYDQWDRLGYIAAARHLVETEIKANPNLAAAPISEIEIDERGNVHWVSRGACDTREPE
jgi:hypothetical protein